MELNYKQQDRYSPDQFKVYIEINGQKIRDTDYLEIDNILRDISFVRQQSTNYSYLYAGPFRFDQMLTLPYWDFLFLKGHINEKELQNIQDGCLLIIALLFVEVFDDEGLVYIYSKNLIDKLDNALNLFQPTTDRQKIAVEKIKFLRQHINNDKVFQLQPDSDRKEIENTIDENCKWLYKEFIENYFRETAKSFEPNRQRTNEFVKQIIEGQKKRTDKKE